MAGATGVLGSRLIPLLLETSHTVFGMTRSEEKVSLLEDLGAQPVLGDVFDRQRMVEVIGALQPDVVMSQLTDLPDDASRLDDFVSANARMRREGVSNLLEAARQNGIARFLAQSVAWILSGEGGRAVEEMEANVLQFGGTVLRYGQFYGPGTYHSQPPEPPRIDIDEAARRTVLALDAKPGIVEITEAER